MEYQTFWLYTLYFVAIRLGCLVKQTIYHFGKRSFISLDSFQNSIWQILVLISSTKISMATDVRLTATRCFTCIERSATKIRSLLSHIISQNHPLPEIHYLLLYKVKLFRKNLSEIKFVLSINVIIPQLITLCYIIRSKDFEVFPFNFSIHIYRKFN